MSLYKTIFVDIFFSFNPNSFGNQRRLFSGNLPGMFLKIENKRKQIP